MKKLIPVLAVMPMLAACQNWGAYSIDCEQHGKAKDVWLDYGENGIQVLTKKVKKKSLYVIKLRPKPKQKYRDKKVTITGKGVDPGGAGAPGPGWLDTEDNYDTRKEFVYCTPDISSDQSYFFSVKVEGVGEVDPRVDVTH